MTKEREKERNGKSYVGIWREKEREKERDLAPTQGLYFHNLPLCRFWIMRLRSSPFTTSLSFSLFTSLQTPKPLPVLPRTSRYPIICLKSISRVRPAFAFVGEHAPYTNACSKTYCGTHVVFKVLQVLGEWVYVVNRHRNHPLLFSLCKFFLWMRNARFSFVERDKNWKEEDM